MTDAATGMDGGISGTNARLDPRIWAMMAALVIFAAIVNTTSVFFHSSHQSLLLTGVCEASSNLSLIVLAPLFYSGFARWPLARLGLRRFATVQIGLAALFSLLHVAMMVSLRYAVFGGIGVAYNYAEGHLGLELLYEMRKDAVTYCVFLSFYALQGRLSKRAPHPDVPPAPPEPKRLEVRVDGRTLYLDPAEILALEAAGNYIEVRTGGASHLVRGSLTAFEQRLSGGGFVRIHRSRLVNRARIRALEATPSGDFTVTLDTGQILNGSRRYRDGLKSSRLTG